MLLVVWGRATCMHHVEATKHHNTQNTQQNQRWKCATISILYENAFYCDGSFETVRHQSVRIGGGIGERHTYETFSLSPTNDTKSMRMHLIKWLDYFWLYDVHFAYSSVGWFKFPPDQWNQSMPYVDSPFLNAICMPAYSISILSDTLTTISYILFMNELFQAWLTDCCCLLCHAPSPVTCLVATAMWLPSIPSTKALASSAIAFKRLFDLI